MIYITTRMGDDAILDLTPSFNLELGIPEPLRQLAFFVSNDF